MLLIQNFYGRLWYFLLIWSNDFMNNNFLLVEIQLLNFIWASCLINYVFNDVPMYSTCTNIWNIILCTSNISATFAIYKPNFLMTDLQSATYGWTGVQFYCSQSSVLSHPKKRKKHNLAYKTTTQVLAIHLLRKTALAYDLTDLNFESASVSKVIDSF